MDQQTLVWPKSSVIASSKPRDVYSDARVHKDSAANAHRRPVALPTCILIGANVWEADVLDISQLLMLSLLMSQTTCGIETIEHC